MPPLELARHGPSSRNALCAGERSERFGVTADVKPGMGRECLPQRRQVVLPDRRCREGPCGLGEVATGIVIANPPNQPSPITYELAIPFSELGITAGQATPSASCSVT
jgi:hypothetical protein